MTFNVIGDIAGQFKTLEALIAKMPPAPILSVGDMVDRGPDSDKVMKFFMETPGAEALLGNHEHMMIDHCERGGVYDQTDWQRNGGNTTLESYNYSVPDAVVQWMKMLPKFKIVELDGKRVFISHAPLFSEDRAAALNLDSGTSIIWNRHKPKRIEEFDMRLSGHNASWGLYTFSDDRGPYAMSIDTSFQKVLTGIHLPTMAVYQQEYIK